MTEKLLPYDRSIVPQETGYWCGPAATQVVLNSRGIIKAESDLARQIGTTTRGTDYVGLIERVLDAIVPDARYTSVYIENDPPTAAQKETLWRNLVASINAGYGVVMNWVAPPSNKPRGVKGSASPAYSGGTTYHYVAAMGYDDNPAARAVWIADSGFRPFGYWVSFDQCATLIPPKGYCYAAAAPAAPAPPAPAPPAAVDLVAILAQAMSPTTVSRDTLAAYLPHFAEAMRAADITTVRRAAAWCSQIGHESAGLRYMAEIQTDGPGWTEDRKRYRGRGPIQLTWSSNYRKFGQWCAARGYITDPELFVNQPELVEQPRWGFLAASWYWLFGGPKPGQINAYADTGDILAVSRCVNGWIEGRNPVGWPDRQERWNRCLALGDQLLTLTTSTTPTDPIEELLMSNLRVPSMSIYATPGEPDVPIIDMIRALDAHGDHESYVERQALLGDTDAIARIVRTAAGKGKYGNAQGPVNQAKDALKQIEAVNPAALKQFLDNQKGSVA
ncbi:endolysin [Mycobacterium phage Xeno]|uniref:Lysin A n=1 Tax=Mycobacterium phage Xeno TaxID=1821538 RepID=A0A142K7M8_9CAUD|nr:endolysin [Mycobacterium phage Xeno]AMS02111.1 lysin A [Mycobacterium phage Xeno]